MALIRWEPAREIESLQQEVNRLFGSFFDVQPGRRSAGASRWIPAMDLVETDDHFVLTADLPGVRSEDVKVEVEDDVLTICGERKISRERREDGVHRIERASGEFSRSLTLPAGVDAEQVQASFEHGVLEVRIPKPQGQRPHRVQVAVGGGASVIEGGERRADANERQGAEQGASAAQSA